MNNITDVEKIVSHLETLGMYVSMKEDANVSKEELTEAYLNAARKVQQYERELKALKLSKEDGKHLSLIRDAFSLTRKSLIAASKGNMMQAKIFMLQAKTKPAEYELRKAKSAKRKSPDG